MDNQGKDFLVFALDLQTPAFHVVRTVDRSALPDGAHMVLHRFKGRHRTRGVTEPDGTPVACAMALLREDGSPFGEIGVPKDGLDKEVADFAFRYFGGAVELQPENQSWLLEGPVVYVYDL